MLVKMKCPYCGANMELDDSREKVFCAYCGSEIANLKERIEITQNINMSGTVTHVMDRSNDPNLYISYATAAPSIVMVVRIVDTGAKSTYLNGQSQSYHLRKGQHTIVFKIGRKSYNRTIIIPEDNTPVRINAAYTGRKAEITIDQPNVTVMDPVTGWQSQQVITTNKKKQSALAVISFILSFLLHLAFLAVPLAILDLVLSKKDRNHKHGLAIAAVIIGSIMCFVVISTYASSAKCSSPKTYSYQTELKTNNSEKTAPKRENEALETENNITELNPVASAEPVETPKPIETPEPTALPTTPEPVIETPNPTPEVISTGIRPEFQKAMDEYLQFFKDYCEFIKKYTKSPNASMAIQYLNFMQDYAEAMEALDKIDEGELSAEELKLYLDTMNEINKMLIDLANGL